MTLHSLISLLSLLSSSRATFVMKSGSPLYVLFTKETKMVEQRKSRSICHLYICIELMNCFVRITIVLPVNIHFFPKKLNLMILNLWCLDLLDSNPCRTIYMYIGLAS